MQANSLAQFWFIASTKKCESDKTFKTMFVAICNTKIHYILRNRTSEVFVSLLRPPFPIPPFSIWKKMNGSAKQRSINFLLRGRSQESMILMIILLYNSDIATSLDILAFQPSMELSYSTCFGLTHLPWKMVHAARYFR